MIPPPSPRAWWALDCALWPLFVPAFGEELLAQWRREVTQIAANEEALAAFLLGSLRGSGPRLWERPRDFRLSCALASRAGAPVVLAWLGAYAGALRGLACDVLDTPGRALLRLPSGEALDLFGTTGRRLSGAALRIFIDSRGGDAERAPLVLAGDAPASRARDSVLFGLDRLGSQWADARARVAALTL